MGDKFGASVSRFAQFARRQTGNGKWLSNVVDKWRVVKPVELNARSTGVVEIVHGMLELMVGDRYLHQ